MFLVKNWKSIFLKSWSLWAMRLSLVATLLAPQLIFSTTGMDLNPVVLGRIALILWGVSEVLRLLDQGLSKDA